MLKENYFKADLVCYAKIEDINTNAIAKHDKLSGFQAVGSQYNEDWAVS